MGKVDRRGHDWVVVATLEVSPAEAKRLDRGTQLDGLEEERLVAVSLLCWRCQVPWRQPGRQEPCSGVGEAPPRPRSSREQQ